MVASDGPRDPPAWVGLAEKHSMVAGFVAEPLTWGLESSVAFH